MRIYLAGPMRGIKDFNFPAFRAATSQLRAQGHTVFNPVERDEEVFGKGTETSETGDLREFALRVRMTEMDVRRSCFLADTEWICRYADAVYLLPGWEQSKGAQAEKALAEALGLEVHYL